ncbi:DEAD/DEAH box helicase [Desulfoluna spongiiphila]|uniref:DEAD/DEAH box helicase n=1 Tax=Desulfoluna spongiiphila TaxID=419481 RepID=UPI00125A8754|nr:type ISP restriction/modification enzyme [Desulfoluna spongiiphila]VVS92216.1 dna methylase adenine-specific [Desulfoluna spongiiphila]
MSALRELLSHYRNSAQTEREKGNYFEELICTYFRYEATYADLYSNVWLYADWAKEQGLDARDTGIDLVAQTSGTNEFHAIQCKFYAENHRVQKRDIDSFFTASGQKPFTHRIIVTTTNDWSDNAEKALIGQQPAVTRIDLYDLECSQIDWAKYETSKAPVIKKKFSLRQHQKNALKAVTHGLAEADRGKLIMACGTGKTFTSLKIAENMAGTGKRVLFLVPSLSLLSQTLTEWTQQSTTPLHSFAVCSDSEIGKKRNRQEDIVETFAHELRYPATTNAKRLAEEVAKRADDHHMSVVFSTYHSINVIHKAQQDFNLADFDLIICDEAHRTTGATFDDESESNFVKVHDNSFIHGAKRIYMTATPRIYADSAKATAERDNTALCSMDNAELYGDQLHVITFSNAVQLGLLTDYKVIVLTIDEDHVTKRLQNLLKDENNELKVDDAARIVGCWKALSKQGVQEDLDGESDPMRRAVAFCQVIEPKKGRVHKVSSKQIAGMFQEVIEAYQEQEHIDESLICETQHVDGSMNATEKESKLNWLKAEAPADTCRILSNVRCLSEGVDVPSLDAVLFLTPRSSQVEVVQSVGRVMRNAKGKKRGYVILPVVIPAGMDPSDALNDNKVYKVVWEVLQALRSHDDRFDAMINKLDLIGKDNKKMEVVAVSDKASRKQKKSAKQKGASARGQATIGTAPSKTGATQLELQFNVGELEKALYAKVVKKCGNRSYWDEWAKDIAKIAQTHISRITAIVSDPANTKEVNAFTNFAEELRDDLNDSISDAEVIEMLAQHLITKPVFDALFADYSFASNNPVSKAMQQVLEILQEHRLEKEADTLEKFYASVKMRADGIDNAEGKQKIVVELYDKFFRNAFPKMTERLGIVYTPVEVVDFIIHSINDLLKSEFGQTLGSEGVHIVDPFTGTGTFITRLLQSGLISKEQLTHKYQNEIHANEIVLLAYYIAAINIEAVYHGIVGGDYKPFNGICLTDTFRHEEEDLISNLLSDNSDRRKHLQNLDVRVIMGNPPYSAGQESANDNNQNVAYPELDASIRNTYAKHSTANNKNALYDSYIRAIRWASDRIENKGIIGFVTNAGFLEANTADGLRKCLAEEFSNIYVFHLRGNQRTSGERSRQEGGKIFGSGSRAPIAISLLVKNPEAAEHGKIYWHDIGDYLTQAQKLEIVSNFQSIDGITNADGWQKITPDKHHDWINQRDDSFYDFIKLGDKKNKNETLIFDMFSRGLETARDAWCYNSSPSEVVKNVQRTISFYNSEINRYIENANSKVKDFINTDSTKISWSSSLLSKLEKHTYAYFSDQKIVQGVYRPFQKQWTYFDGMFNHRVGQMPQIFPIGENVSNRVISITGRGSTKAFCAFISAQLPDLEMVSKGQCFPLYLYEKAETSESDLFGGASENEYTRKDGISDGGLAHFAEKYPNESISKEDLFYYIYGLLHSPAYRKRYADNLTKELPRIPAVNKASDFWSFSQAGRDLAELHLNYETVEKYPVQFDTGSIKINSLTASDYRVTKMKFRKVKNPETGKKVNDKTTVLYNERITIKNIPLEAYSYIVNGKPALDWVMERQGVTTDKKSGIVNDANLWATETMKNAKYPIELFQRVITVSLKTMKIVDSLPALDID